MFKIFLRDLSLLESQDSDISGPLPWSIGAEQWKLGVQLQFWNRLGADGNMEFDFITIRPPETSAVPFKRGPQKNVNFETVPETQTPLEILTAVTRALNGGLNITPHGAKRFVLSKNQQEFLLDDLEKEPASGILSDGIAGEAERLAAGLGERGPLGSLWCREKAVR